MRLNEIIEDPFKRWADADLELDVLLEEELHRIVDLGDVQRLHEKDPENNRPLNTREKVELNKIFRKAANRGKRITL